MGASNAMCVYRLYGAVLGDAAMRVLTFMALVARDGDAEPWCGIGHEALSEFALSRPLNGNAQERDAALRAVRRAVTDLRRAGAITTAKRPTNDGGKVRYRLWLTEPSPDAKRPVNSAPDCGQPAVDNPPSPDAQRPTGEPVVGRIPPAHRTENVQFTGRSASYPIERNQGGTNRGAKTPNGSLHTASCGKRARGPPQGLRPDHPSATARQHAAGHHHTPGEPMTRIDMTTREWHELVKPVLPHTFSDKDFPELSHIRIEVTANAVCAIATDHYTLGAERHPLIHGHADAVAPIALHASDVKATLKLFTYSKDENPELRVTIDRASVPIAVAGTPASAHCLAITLEDEAGVRVVLRDATTPNRAPLASWRKKLRDALRRPLAGEMDALSLHAGQLARWSAAVRPGERLAIYPGDDEKAPLLVLAENHFAGIWVLQQHLEGPGEMLSESPWNYELHEIEAE